MKFDFKQYYDSKMKLLEAVDSSPRIKLKYKLTKYCKIPIFETIETNTKTYLSLKPDDELEVLWEYDSPDNPTIKFLKFHNTDNPIFPAWSSPKMFSWLLNNTDEI